MSFLSYGSRLMQWVVAGLAVTGTLTATHDKHLHI